MNWAKRGLVFCPDGTNAWMKTHAAMPVADRIRGDLYRIYFATRDSDSRSRVGYIEIDVKHPETVLRVAKNPAVDLGTLGAFDHYGVLPACVVNFDSKKYLYYTGWDRGAEVYKFFIGLAISEDGGETFSKVSNVPVVDRSKEDPYLCISPYVMIENETWKMWYSSGLLWERARERLSPRYCIKYAESKDGINWQRTNIVSIGFKSGDEWAVARPSVVKDGGTYKMLFCYSAAEEGYRIGYAESKDGIRWSRRDEEAGIDVSSEGWDSEMVCYPFVFTHSGVRYMLYNGNNFGKTGFGYATEQSRDE